MGGVSTQALQHTLYADPLIDGAVLGCDSNGVAMAAQNGSDGERVWSIVGTTYSTTSPPVVIVQYWGPQLLLSTLMCGRIRPSTVSNS